MSKLLYIHGFASCGKGQKSMALADRFGREKVLAPDLSPSPETAISLLASLIESEDVSLLVGSSLGGYYAGYLAEHYSMKAVLINPSIHPYETLKPYVGSQERFCDRSPFLFEADYLEALKHFRSQPSEGRYLVLLQSGDEVLDYTQAKQYYKDHRVIVEYGGNHRFENIGDYLSMIGNFKDGK
jgi:predicted esterase YcpF (UPF0227 family)